VAKEDREESDSPSVRIPCTISFSSKEEEWCVSITDAEGRSRSFIVSREYVEVAVPPMIESAGPHIPFLIEGCGTVRAKLLGYLGDTIRVEIPQKPRSAASSLLVPASDIVLS
jgi:hypothetical protein